MGNSLILRKLYSAADLLLMPSTLEAFGQTAIEAGSCNIPTVGFMNTGVQESIIHKKTGYIAKFSDIKRPQKNAVKVLKEGVRIAENKNLYATLPATGDSVAGAGDAVDSSGNIIPKP